MAQIVREPDAQAVIGSQDHAINEQQNSDRSLMLLKAADAAHKYASRSEAARATTVSLFAVASVVASVYTQFAWLLAAVGILATLATELMWPWIAGRWTHTATLIQEMLDTELFGLEWNKSLGQRVPEARVHRLASWFRDDVELKRNWYVDVARLPRAYAVLVCQRENLLWDTDLRLAWARWVAIATTVWLVLGLVISVIGHWYTQEWLIRWIAPSAPAIVFALRHVYGQWKVAMTKDALRLTVEAELNRAGVPLTQQRHSHLLHKAREFQDGIASLRDRHEHVPQFFYIRRRRSDEAAHVFDAQQMTERLLAARDKP